MMSILRRNNFVVAQENIFDLNHAQTMDVEIANVRRWKRIAGNTMGAACAAHDRLTALSNRVFQ